MNSLLRSLLTDHVDPGYAIAADNAELQPGRRAQFAAGAWLVGGLAVIGLVLGVAVAKNLAHSGRDADRDQILSQVQVSRERGSILAAERDELAVQADSARAAALAGTAEGAPLLDRIDDLEAASAASAVHGPGVTITLADGGSEGRSIVLDRDLRAVVNALWASGAEAISIGDKRIGPAVAVRQAGGAILVDNVAVSSPYRISAIGPPSKLQTGFVVSDAYLRMSGLAQLYGVGFDIGVADDLELPAATLPEVRSVREGGG